MLFFFCSFLRLPLFSDLFFEFSSISSWFAIYPPELIFLGRLTCPLNHFLLPTPSHKLLFQIFASPPKDYQYKKWNLYVYLTLSKTVKLIHTNIERGEYYFQFRTTRILSRNLYFLFEIYVCDLGLRFGLIQR
jgi:hypothetical protein